MAGVDAGRSAKNASWAARALWISKHSKAKAVVDIALADKLHKTHAQLPNYFLRFASFPRLVEDI